MRYAPPVPRPLPYATPTPTTTAPPAALRPVAWTLVGLYLAGFALVLAVVAVLGSPGAATCVAPGGLLPVWLAVAVTVVAAGQVEDRHKAGGVAAGHGVLALPWLALLGLSWQVPRTAVAAGYYGLIVSYAGLHLAVAVLVLVWRRRLTEPRPPRRDRVGDWTDRYLDETWR